MKMRKFSQRNFLFTQGQLTFSGYFNAVMRNHNYNE